MSERVETAVARFQKWCLQRFHWIALSGVALCSADLVFSTHLPPVLVWMDWICILSGSLLAIMWPSHLRKIAEREQKRTINK